MLLSLFYFLRVCVSGQILMWHNSSLFSSMWLRKLYSSSDPWCSPPPHSQNIQKLFLHRLNPPHHAHHTLSIFLPPCVTADANLMWHWPFPLLLHRRESVHADLEKKTKTEIRQKIKERKKLLGGTKSNYMEGKVIEQWEWQIWDFLEITIIISRYKNQQWCHHEQLSAHVNKMFVLTC